MKLETVIVAEVVGGGEVHSNLGSAAGGLIKLLNAEAWCFFSFFSLFFFLKKESSSKTVIVLLCHQVQFV